MLFTVVFFDLIYIWKHLLKKAGKTWDDVVEPRAKLYDINTLAIEAFKKGVTTSKRLPFIADEENIEPFLLKN